MSEIPRGAIQVVLKIKTKWGKHTLTEDCKRRTKDYRLWEMHTQWVMIDPMKRVEPIFLQKAHDSWSSSDSGAWVHVDGDLEFTCKIFNDPKNISFNEENTPLNDTQTMLTLNDLNITDSTRPEGLPERPTNFVGPYCPKCILRWHKCLCITELDREDNVTQQMPMPRTSSPYPDESDKRLEKLETETEDELHQIDYRARPANDRRPPKHRCRQTFRISPPNWLKMTAPHLRQVPNIL